MAYEMLIGLQVDDDEIYSKYRKAIKPLLSGYGGGFRYDFRVSEVMENEEANPINRVFVIFFENKSNKNSFFSNSEYQEIKQKFFACSVQATTIISEYER